ncbi:MAG: hypothetical protein QG562_592, partial [Patescibacteria group bacterium]|nr:hypothetical protein [Patescibacteria group bacterium]
MKNLFYKLLQKTAIFSFVFIIILNSFVFVAQAQQQDKPVRDLIKSGLRYYDISENCNFEQPTTGNTPGTLPGTVPEPYNGIITKASQAAGIPPALLAAIWVAENSGFAGAEEAGEPYDIKSFEWRMPPPPYGTGEPWPTSYAAAKGPFQFIDGTWDAYQADGN